jgi:hypothetical protein
VSYYDQARQQWVIEVGDLVYWIDDEGRPVRAKAELITDARIYLKGTSLQADERAGEVWYENRFGRRVTPREGVYIDPAGRLRVNWAHIRIEG